MNRKPLRDINKIEVESPSKMSKTKPAPLAQTVSRSYSAKREASEDPETPIKRQKTIENPSETSDPDNAFTQNISNVLGKHYFDVVDRLKLDATPECVIKLTKCTNDHSSNGSNNKCPIEFDTYMTREIAAFVSDGKIDVFFEQLSNIMMKGEFLGENLLQLMLETMLATNECKFQQDFSEKIQEMGHDIFMQTMKKFPPCWTKIRDHYLLMMTDPLQMETFQNPEYEKDKGLFNLLILLLEHNLRNADEESPSTSRNHNNLDLTMEMNFAAWEEHTKQTYDFKKNSRKEKMERIFRVLGLLVNLMERDLAIWMLRNPRNIKTSLGKSDKKPLIAVLLWPNQECSLNFAVKRIMKIFIESVHLNYPKSDLEVLSRLMNLIATCVNLAEIPTIREKNVTVEYPSIDKNILLFTRELKRLMDDFPHFSITLYVNVLKNLRTPCIKSVLARQILARINPCKDNLKAGRDTPLHLLMSSLNHRDWRDADPRPPTSPSETDETSVKYPTMPLKATTRKKVLDIYKEDLISIQLTEVESHMNLYRVNDVYNTLRTPLEFNDANNNHEPETTDFATFDIKMLKNLSQHVRKNKVQFSNEELPKNDPPNERVFKSINLNQDFILNYREQIKLCYHLQCFFDKAVAKYPELTDFQAYFNKNFTKE